MPEAHSDQVDFEYDVKLLEEARCYVRDNMAKPKGLPRLRTWQQVDKALRWDDEFDGACPLGFLPGALVGDPSHLGAFSHDNPPSLSSRKISLFWRMWDNFTNPTTACAWLYHV